MSKSEIRTLKLENLIKEAVTLALYEQDQQPMANPGPVPPPAPPGPPEQNQPPQPQPGSPDQQAAQQPPMTIDSMIERLNVIRGGKSFTDPEVYGQLVTYFKKLTPDQNQVIDQYLQDISRIMISVRTGGSDDGQNADQAGQPPAQNNSSPQAPISPGQSASAPAPAAATSPGPV